MYYVNSQEFTTPKQTPHSCVKYSALLFYYLAMNKNCPTESKRFFVPSTNKIARYIILMIAWLQRRMSELKSCGLHNAE